MEGPFGQLMPLLPVPQQGLLFRPHYSRSGLPRASGAFSMPSKASSPVSLYAEFFALEQARGAMSLHAGSPADPGSEAVGAIFRRTQPMEPVRSYVCPCLVAGDDDGYISVTPCVGAMLRGGRGDGLRRDATFLLETSRVTCLVHATTAIWVLWVGHIGRLGSSKAVGMTALWKDGNSCRTHRSRFGSAVPHQESDEGTMLWSEQVPWHEMPADRKASLRVALKSVRRVLGRTRIHSGLAGWGHAVHWHEIPPDRKALLSVASERPASSRESHTSQRFGGRRIGR